MSLKHSGSLSPQVLHYVEKPETFVSSIINAGAYLFSPDIFQYLSQVYTANYENELMYIHTLDHSGTLTTCIMVNNLLISS